jgi:chromosome segregation ATPase
MVFVQAEIQSHKEALRSRDAALQDVQSELQHLQRCCDDHVAAKQAALAERSAVEAALEESERRLQVAEDKLAQVAPIMRRIASRASS